MTAQSDEDAIKILNDARDCLVKFMRGDRDRPIGSVCTLLLSIKKIRPPGMISCRLCPLLPLQENAICTLNFISPAASLRDKKRFSRRILKAIDDWQNKTFPPKTVQLLLFPEEKE